MRASLSVPMEIRDKPLATPQQEIAAAPQNFSLSGGAVGPYVCRDVHVH